MPLNKAHDISVFTYLRQQKFKMYVDQVLSSINEVAVHYISKTKTFLTESDFKVALANQIRDNLKTM